MSLQSSADNWYQGVQAVLVLGMTANKSIAILYIKIQDGNPILPNTGKYWAIPQCQYRSNPNQYRGRPWVGSIFFAADSLCVALQISKQFSPIARMPTHWMPSSDKILTQNGHSRSSI